jgi:hypothetical protein
VLSRSVRAIAEAARSLRASRCEIMAANGWSLRDLYRNLATPEANRLRDAHAPSTPLSAPPTARTPPETPLPSGWH